jgi:hypothetical protein
MRLGIVRRYGHNPILTKAEIPYSVETVHNAAVGGEAWGRIHHAFALQPLQLQLLFDVKHRANPA